MTHLLVTNDFPPKVGGIQSYLWELWRRLDPESFAVLTSAAGPDHVGFDRRVAEVGVRVTRWPAGMLLPSPRLGRAVRARAAEIGAGLVVLDPALPVGLLGPSLGLPYALVLHGAEVTVPARLPVTAPLLRRSIAGACLLVAAGGYPAEEAQRLAGDLAPPVVEVPPGVDTDRLRPASPDERLQARSRCGVTPDVPLVVSVSRLVPRKGMDVLVRAAALLRFTHPSLRVLIAGAGRESGPLERLVQESRAPVDLLGGVSEEHKRDLLQAADVFVMACRNRWAGYEQEGFGIVFLEAAAAGAPQVAGRSGGAHEAVEHEGTGLVVDHPEDPAAVTRALRRLLDDPALRHRMVENGRRRVERSFAYALLAPRLAEALAKVGG